MAPSAFDVTILYRVGHIIELRATEWVFVAR